MNVLRISISNGFVRAYFLVPKNEHNITLRTINTRRGFVDTTPEEVSGNRV